MVCIVSKTWLKEHLHIDEQMNIMYICNTHYEIWYNYNIFTGRVWQQLNTFFMSTGFEEGVSLFLIKNQKTIFLFLQIFNNCDNFWTSGDSQARRVARHKNEVKQFPEFICVQIWIIRLSKSGGISRHADKEEQNLADVVEEVSLFRIHKYCLSVKTKFPLICHFREG